MANSLRLRCLTDQLGFVPKEIFCAQFPSTDERGVTHKAARVLCSCRVWFDVSGRRGVRYRQTFLGPNY